MAGPTSSVLFDTVPSEMMKVEIANTLHEISDSVKGDDFWVVSTKSINGSVHKVEGRPFGLEWMPIDSENCHYTEEEFSYINEIVRFNPVYDLGIYAMSNREIDHLILGELSLFFAEKYNGVIDFGSEINPKNQIEEGNLWEIPYESVSGLISFYNLADADFMKAWIKEEDFHMIK